MAVDWTVDVAWMAFLVLAAVMAMIDSAHETALYRRYSMAYVCELSHHAYVVVVHAAADIPYIRYDHSPGYMYLRT